jgi:hypothetical protein
MLELDSHAQPSLTTRPTTAGRGASSSVTLLVDPNQILCERYQNRKGDQRLFGRDTPLELVSGTQFFKNQRKLFDNIVGFTKFSEYLVVAQVGLVTVYATFAL